MATPEAAITIHAIVDVPRKARPALTIRVWKASASRMRWKTTACSPWQLPDLIENDARVQ